jgi:hypothetical protein
MNDLERQNDRTGPVRADVGPNAEARNHRWDRLVAIALVGTIAARAIGREVTRRIQNHDTAAGGYDIKVRTTHLRLNPIVAIAIATVGLALIFGFETGRLEFRRSTLETATPAAAVDISLERLIRSRVTRRLQRERRLNAPPNVNEKAIDEELRRTREHPVYLMIKATMTDHLEEQGYQRVAIKRTLDESHFMLSMDEAAAFDKIIRSYRSSMSISDEKFATFLNEQEQLFGSSTVTCRGAGRYDISFAFLIQLLAEYPRDLDPVAGAISFIHRSTEEIERERRGARFD